MSVKSPEYRAARAAKVKLKKLRSLRYFTAKRQRENEAYKQSEMIHKIMNPGVTIRNEVLKKKVEVEELTQV